MMLLFVGGVLACWWAESHGNPIHHALGVAAADGNMEGKEVRFGIFNSSLFATITTAASCGAVNSMHDSFTAIGGLVPLFMIELGEVVIGGVGAGLYGMLVFVVLAVFIAGLMVGRTPEYLGKKIQAFDVKMCDARPAGAHRQHPRLHRLGRRQRLGPGGPQQCRAARLQRNPLRLQLRHRQQRQRLRRSHRHSRQRRSCTTTSRSASPC